jgi:hypothetical protein
MTHGMYNIKMTQACITVAFYGWYVWRDPQPKACIKLSAYDMEPGYWVFVSSFLIQVESHSLLIAVMPVLPSQQIAKIIIIIVNIHSLIYSNQSYNESRHVKYVISIKCHSIIIK